MSDRSPDAPRQPSRRAFDLARLDLCQEQLEVALQALREIENIHSAGHNNITAKYALDRIDAIRVYAEEGGLLERAWGIDLGNDLT